VGLIAAFAATFDGNTLQAGGQTAAVPVPPPAGPPESHNGDVALSAEQLIQLHTQARLADDLLAVQKFRPGYAFWQHIFTIPDGSIAFGSAIDGRVLAVLPVDGDWTRPTVWEDEAFAFILSGQKLPRRLTDRRDHLASLLEEEAGPIVHNATRGMFLLPNVSRYGGFVGEWGAIYERFGVPAEIGLAQVIIESGLNGTIRSEARAVGFCQWLAGNWKRLQRLAPHVIEGHNQTTQAPYCAAYLTILATKYGSFIPALSEHHAGGTNVGRTVINGERLGGRAIREQYFLGAELTRHLRATAPRRYREVYGTYGPRSFRYAEMVFGNTFNVTPIRATIPQARIHAMRVRRALPLAEIVRVTRLSADEVRRFNPALVRQVPAGANLYLPLHVEAFGPDVSFWHRPPGTAYASVLYDFLRLDATPDEWDARSFEPVLRDFQRRFRETGTEEGSVMSTVLAYTMDELYASRRAAILAEFRSSERVRRLVEQAVVDREAAGVQAAAR
jgi:hypothetical protein